MRTNPDSNLVENDNFITKASRLDYAGRNIPSWNYKQTAPLLASTIFNIQLEKMAQINLPYPGLSKLLSFLFQETFISSTALLLPSSENLG